MESVRQQKVNKLIGKELAEIFRSEARALFGGGLITVTQVRVSPDLGTARVYLSIFSPGDKKAIFRQIEAQNHVIRRKLGAAVGKQVGGAGVEPGGLIAELETLGEGGEGGFTGDLAMEGGEEGGRFFDVGAVAGAPAGRALPVWVASTSTLRGNTATCSNQLRSFRSWMLR